MIKTYDQRPISEIREKLISSDINFDDLLNVCIVLCDRIDILERRVLRVETGQELND